MKLIPLDEALSSIDIIDNHDVSSITNEYFINWAKAWFSMSKKILNSLPTIDPVEIIEEIIKETNTEISDFGLSSDEWYQWKIRGLKELKKRLSTNPSSHDNSK